VVGKGDKVRHHVNRSGLQLAPHHCLSAAHEIN
jgi:hypothetical protein